MKWTELVTRVAARTGFAEDQVRSVFSTLTDEVGDALERGEHVTLRGLGSIEARWLPERTLRSVHDGRRIAVDGRFQAVFRPADGIRAVLRRRTPQLLKDPAHQRAWRLAETLVSDLGLYHVSETPTDLSQDSGLGEVDTSCKRALGAAWTRARATYDTQTPADVRLSRDYLAMAARRRWAVRA